MNGSTIIGFVLGVAAAIGVGGLMAGIGSAAAGPTMTPEETVAHWLDAAQIGDVDGMLAVTAESAHGTIEADRTRLVRLVNAATAPLVNADEYARSEAEVGQPDRTGRATPLPPAGSEAAGEDAEAESSPASSPSSPRFSFTVLVDRTRLDGATATVLVQLERRGQERLREFTLGLDETSGDWRIQAWRNPAGR